MKWNKKRPPRPEPLQVANKVNDQVKKDKLVKKTERHWRSRERKTRNRRVWVPEANRVLRKIVVQIH